MLRVVVARRRASARWLAARLGRLSLAWQRLLIACSGLIRARNLGSMSSRALQRRGTHGLAARSRHSAARPSYIPNRIPNDRHLPCSRARARSGVSKRRPSGDSPGGSAIHRRTLPIRPGSTRAAGPSRRSLQPVCNHHRRPSPAHRRCNAQTTGCLCGDPGHDIRCPAKSGSSMRVIRAHTSCSQGYHVPSSAGLEVVRGELGGIEDVSVKDYLHNAIIRIDSLGGIRTQQ